MGWYKIYRFSDSRLVVCLCFKDTVWTMPNHLCLTSNHLILVSYYSWILCLFQDFLSWNFNSGNVSVDSCLDWIAEVFLSLIFLIFFWIYPLSYNHIMSSLFKGVQSKVTSHSTERLCVGKLPLFSLNFAGFKNGWGSMWIMWVRIINLSICVRQKRK